MNLALLINGEYLDIPAGISLRLEQQNHLLNLSTELVGEYSLPIVIEMSDKNVRLLGNPQHAASVKSASGIPAQLWADGIPHSNGMVIIEQVDGHFNLPQRGTISIYYTFKLGAFWQLAQKKTLRDVQYGNGYSFVWNGFDIDGPNTGFIGHVTDVMNNSDPLAYDYAFFPVLNEAGLSVGSFNASNIIMNCCAPLGAGIIPTRFTPDINSDNLNIYYNQFTPFPYHRFLLQKIFRTYNWTIEGTPLNDPDFLRLVFIHTGAIGYQLSAAAGSMNVEWNFNTMLPKLSIGNYLVSLANRFGWWFNFDDNTRTCTVRYRKDFLSARVKREYTGMSRANFSSKITSGKIYKLEHAGATEALKESQLNYQGEVNNQYQLPVATVAMENNSYLVRAENAFYVCVVSDTNVPGWEKNTDNLANYEPDGATESISTNMQLPGSVFIPYRNTALAELVQHVAIPSINGIDGDGEVQTFYSAFYHGVQQTINNVAAANYAYPFSSVAPYSLNGVKLRNYALTWKFANAAGDEGIYRLFYKTFLDFIIQREEVKIWLDWSMQDVMNYRYDQTVIIRNTEYLVATLRTVLPLRDFTEVEAIRVV